MFQPQLDVTIRKCADLPGGAGPVLRALRTTAWSLCLLSGLGGSLLDAAHAQSLYRIVGPDGKVTFTDQPPPATAKAVTTPALKSSASEQASLPYELRQATSKHPVTLYTTDKCKPCDSGRQMLSARGIPFAERTITSNDDAQALQRLSGANSLPFLSVGSKQISGYSDSEWAQSLDSAGYPAKSVLPSNFRNAPAEPLVTVQKAPPPAEVASPPKAERAPVAPPAPGNANPAGIVF